MTLRIEIIGRLNVTRDGDTVELPHSKKTRALLAYLAMSDRPQRRDRLCEMFWDVPDDPRGALRWSLSKLRRILNDDRCQRLQADRETVAIDKSDLQVDLAEVNAVAIPEIATTPVEVLEKAVAGVGGRLMEDLSLPNCPPFEAWRIAHVNEFEVRQLAILHELVNRTMAEPARALPYAQALQSLDPDDPEIGEIVQSLNKAARESVVHPPSGADGPVSPATAPDEGRLKSLPVVDIVQQRRLDQTISFCTARDGTRIAYAVSGSGPPVVRAPHWMTHLEYELESPVWRHWIEALSAENTLVRFDYRCNGLSERGVVNVTHEAWLSDMEAVVDAAGLDRFVIFGMSQGGAMALEYAVRHPERTAGIVICGGFSKGWRARGDNQEIARREAMETLILTGWGRSEPAYRQIFTSIFLPGASAEQADWYNELQARTVTPEDAYRLSQQSSLTDVSAILHKVEVPTLVAHARGDLVAPFEFGKALAGDIPHARFVELESNNHVLLEDEPAFGRFISEFRRFLADEAVLRRLEPAEPQCEPCKVSALAIELSGPLLDLDDLDIEAGADPIEVVLDDLCAIVQGYGGECVSRGETDITAVFGANGGAGDHAVQACRAALTAKGHIASLAAEHFGMKAAVDTADAVIRHSGPPGSAGITATGRPIRVARQIARALGCNAVATTARALDAAQGCFAAGEIDKSMVAGLPEGRKIFALSGEAGDPVGERPASPGPRIGSADR
jgi:pimeloyl-ACP methyl ester carboxylesterase/DNA-binding SARP family transcriptional activator